MTEAERQAALEQIAEEVRVCTRCRLHQQRTRSVPGEGNPETEVVFVGEGPGFNEDREGRPFVGRAGGLLVKLLASIGWQREDVFITNVVKCRPPENRDPEADEIAACAPFLRRQLQVLDPALVVTLGRYSMATFMPGARIGQAHGTMRPADPATGAADAIAFAMYHPAAALRSTDVEQTSFRDIAGVPAALLQSREQRARHAEERAAAPAVAEERAFEAAEAHAAADGDPMEEPPPEELPATFAAPAGQSAAMAEPLPTLVSAPPAQAVPLAPAIEPHPALVSDPAIVSGPALLSAEGADTDQMTIF